MKNLWDSKPFWCQPWSVIATGFLTVLLSFLFVKILILNLILLIIVLLWWLLFLYYAPLIYSTQLNEYQHQDTTND